MYCLKPSLLLALTLASSAWAEEGKKESQTSAISRELLEFNSKESRLNSLESRIKDAQLRFNQNLDSKKRTTDAAKQKYFAAQMMAIAKERNSYVTEYNELRQEILYRYPNRGQEIDKRFIPRQHKSVTDLENTSDLDRQLTKVKDRITEKYAPLMPAEELAPSPTATTKSNKPEPEKRLRLIK